MTVSQPFAQVTSCRRLDSPCFTRNQNSPGRRYIHTRAFRPRLALKFDLETLTRFAVMFGPGEISVMALAKELQATAVLDERAARAEAVKLGLKITGTLGLLNDARQRNWLTDDACLEKTRLLQSKGFRIPKPGANQTFAEYLTAFE